MALYVGDSPRQLTGFWGCVKILFKYLNTEDVG